MNDDLVLDEHRPVADGTRPLQVGQRCRVLSPELLEHARARTCWSARMAAHLHTEAPQHCRQQIAPGEHYLLWTEHDVTGKPTGRTEAYCAPCAIAEWDVYQVTEASL